MNTMTCSDEWACPAGSAYSRSLGFSFDDDGSLVKIKPISVSESESDNLEVPSMVHFNLFCFLKFIPLSL